MEDVGRSGVLFFEILKGKWGKQKTEIQNLPNLVELIGLDGGELESIGANWTGKNKKGSEIHKHLKINEKRLW
jgi:hypothetical protein